MTKFLIWIVIAGIITGSLGLAYARWQWLEKEHDRQKALIEQDGKIKDGLGKIIDNERDINTTTINRINKIKEDKHAKDAPTAPVLYDSIMRLHE